MRVADRAAYEPGGARVLRQRHPGQPADPGEGGLGAQVLRDRKSTRLNSSHLGISYAVFCLKKRYSHCRARSVATRTALPAGRPPRRRWGRSHRTATSFFNDTATAEIYTLSLHDALPI